MDRGVLYVATGRPHLERARRSAAAVRRVRPELPLAVCSDRDPDGAVFDRYIPVESPYGGIEDKCRNLYRSPFERTVYLDADTYVCSEHFFEEVFPVLERFDLAATHDVGRRHDLKYNESYDAYPHVDAPASVPWHNTGVLAYRDTDAVASLFEDWIAVHDRHRRDFDRIESTRGPAHAMDQPAFREALFNSNVRYATLPLEYNCRIGFGHYLNGPVRLVHGGVTNHAAVAERLNRSTGPRSFRSVIVHGEGVVRMQPAKYAGIPRQLWILWLSLWRFGPRYTLRALRRWAGGGTFNRPPDERLHEEREP